MQMGLDDSMGATFRSIISIKGLRGKEFVSVLILRVLRWILVSDGQRDPF